MIIFMFIKTITVVKCLEWLLERQAHEMAGLKGKDSKECMRMKRARKKVSHQISSRSSFMGRGWNNVAQNDVGMLYKAQKQGVHVRILLKHRDKVQCTFRCMFILECVICVHEIHVCSTYQAPNRYHGLF